MEYRKLGKAGIKLSEISFGSWFTFGVNLDLSNAKQCMRTAFDYGINFFDNAEIYANGAAELLMGEALRDFKRDEVVVSTKIFFGTGNKGPNSAGLSYKHIMEGTKNALRRLQLSYVDLIYCHRPDTDTPIEETVRAMDAVIRSGMAFYWGTSEWKRSQIEEAYKIAEQIGAIPPSMEQPEYNLFHRERVEKEYVPLYEKYDMGLTTWSPLASGLLTGKYNEGIPEKTRLALHPEMQNLLTPEKINKVKELAKIAKEIGCTMAQLAIAWCLKNKHVSTVMIGASNLQQLQDNLKATEVKNLLVDEIMQKIDKIMKN